MESNYSLSKAVYHTDLVKKLQNNEPIAPTQLQIDLEAWCNHNCSFCSYRAEESHNLDMLELIGESKKSLPMLDEFKPIGKPTEESSLPLYFAEELPRQIAEAGIKCVTLTGGGESTLWKRYDDFIRELVKYKIQIGLITNGSTLHQNRIIDIVKHYAWIRFSMDGCTAKTHRAIHRTPTETFDKIIASIKEIVRLRKEGVLINDSGEELTVGINYVITEESFDEIESSCEFYSKLGVDYVRFSFMYIEGVGVGQFALERKAETIKLFDRLIKKYNTKTFKVSPATYKLDSYTHENDDFDECYMQDFVWALSADCKVYPCCIQKYKKGWEFGDIRKTTLKKLITKAFGQRRKLDVTDCPPCWMRDRNKAMISAIKRPKHVNFI